MYILPSRTDFGLRWRLFGVSGRSILYRGNRTMRLLPGQLHRRTRRRLPTLLTWILRITGSGHMFQVQCWSIVGRRRLLYSLSSQLHIRARGSLYEMLRWLQFCARGRGLFGVPARSDFRRWPAVWRLPGRSILEPGRGGLSELPGRLQFDHWIIDLLGVPNRTNIDGRRNLCELLPRTGVVTGRGTVCQLSG